MTYLNVEIKARCPDPQKVREYLNARGAEFRGLDIQTDTYFNVTRGRLKLREGNIESNLIYYERPNDAGPKHSQFQLLPVAEPSVLKQMLTRSNGIKIIVTKHREIYYIGNVKFHIDDVPGLGAFVEIEAGNIRADLSAAELNEQCAFYQQELGIREEDLQRLSYSDLLLAPVT